MPFSDRELKMVDNKAVVAIAPGELKDIWPSVREHVASIETPDHAILEEVYAMCFTNQATLFILKIDGKPVGHAIVRLCQPDLHLWQVYGENGHNVLELFKPELLELAKKVGAKFITFGSARGAWKKVGEELGFRPRMIIYEMPVE